MRYLRTMAGAALHAQRADSLAEGALALNEDLRPCERAHRAIGVDLFKERGAKGGLHLCPVRNRLIPADLAALDRHVRLAKEVARRAPRKSPCNRFVRSWWKWALIELVVLGAADDIAQA